MSTRRGAIMDAMKSRFHDIVAGEPVTVSGEEFVYTHTFAGHVWRWRKTTFEKNEPPGVDIRDQADPMQDAGVNERTDHRLAVELEVHAAPGKDGPDDILDLVADLLRAIGSDPTWGGLAIDTAVAGLSEPEVELEANIVTGMQINLTVLYRTKHWQL